MDGKEVFITEKQLSIIELIHKGNPIKCIEYELGISAQTVRNYLHRLKGKLSCSTTEDLVRLWHENRK
jgi:DNA-binding NarL/FixJ family response regulator